MEYPEKVTESSLRATDSVLLGALARQGIDKDYVEFTRDYARRSSYTKHYRNRKNNQHFAVTSGLPMVDAYGNRHEIRWFDRRGIVENGNNIFHAIVDKTSVRLIILSNQPNGLKKNHECYYTPQILINGSKVLPKFKKPKILGIDPINENYHENVLEWEYDGVIRRIRIIEGKYRERWITNIRGVHEIRHNVTGFPIKLGYYRRADGFDALVSVIGDREILNTTDYPDSAFPVEIGAELTVYPDADTEAATVDGYARHYNPDGMTWATIVAAAGQNAFDNQDLYYVINHNADDEANKWRHLQRAIYLFDTSSLPDDAVIDSATLSIYGSLEGKVDTLGAEPSTNIYTSAPASNTALVAGDYDSLGSAALCDTPITWANWTNGYNNFTLNGLGLTKISKTGITKLGARCNLYDVAEAEPPWVNIGVSRTTAYYSEQGSGYKPKLVVTYYLEGSYRYYQTPIVTWTSAVAESGRYGADSNESWDVAVAKSSERYG